MFDKEPMKLIFRDLIQNPPKDKPPKLGLSYKLYVLSLVSLCSYLLIYGTGFIFNFIVGFSLVLGLVLVSTQIAVIWLVRKIYQFQDYDHEAIEQAKQQVRKITTVWLKGRLSSWDITFLTILSFLTLSATVALYVYGMVTYSLIFLAFMLIFVYQDTIIEAAFKEVFSEGA